SVEHGRQAVLADEAFLAIGGQHIAEEKIRESGGGAGVCIGEAIDAAVVGGKKDAIELDRPDVAAHLQRMPSEDVAEADVRLFGILDPAFRSIGQIADGGKAGDAETRDAVYQRRHRDPGNAELRNVPLADLFGGIDRVLAVIPEAKIEERFRSYDVGA